MYKALALQTQCNAVNRCKNREEARLQMKETILTLAQQIRAAKMWIGSDLKLVVLPEYFLTGFPLQESIEEWKQKATLEMQDEIYDKLGEICQQNNLFLSGNAYETDPHFPNLYFQTSFCLDDTGDLILRYRRLVSMFAPTPHDVWDKYLDIYGLTGVFAVAKTSIGNLAAIASEEILYPEIARCLMMQGAEIFLHSTSEVYTGFNDTPKNIAKMARAYENMAYVVSANSAGIFHTPIPKNSTDGGSKIIDFNGKILTETAQGESMNAFATLHLDALKKHRTTAGMPNVIARQRFELFAESYAANSFYPPNIFSDQAPHKATFIKTQENVIQNLITKEII